MPPPLAAALTEFFSSDALIERWHDLVDYAQNDWMGFAFWCVVWTGSFCTTFLLLRMLFTRWGDTNVTRKTMAVSLLAHFVLGLLSTRMVFSHVGSGGRGSGRELIIRPSRRTVIEGEQFAVGSRVTGPPLWERRAQPRSEGPTRVARAQPPPGVRESPPRRPADEELAPAVSLPDLPDAQEAPVAPEAQRTTERQTRPVTAGSSPIAEETALARPETGSASGGPQRTARVETGLPSTEPARHSRPQSVEKLPIAVPPAGDVTAVVAPGLSQPALRRPGTGDEAPLRSAPTPSAAPIGDAASTVAGSSAQGAQGSEATKPFSRVERRQATEIGALAADRVPIGEAPPAVDAGAPRIIASRSGTSDTLPDGLRPDIVRPDAVGAIDVGGGKVPAPYRLRGLPERKKIAIEMGATEDSERAVETSLQWLARHQRPDGSWQPIESILGREPDENKFTDLAERQRSGLQSESGLTALALLAFLGANYTHEDNQYADNVDRALRWLIAQQGSDGFLGGRANKYAGMYCHGMAAIALGEAYGMTKDSALREPLARAIQYIVDRQHSGDGGWRYVVGQTGDMSMFGWQLMALKSAHTAGLKVPRESVERAIDFLLAHGEDLKTRRLSRFGGLAAYRKGERPKPSMTAEALFCKQMLGLKRDDPAVGEAVEYLQQNLPRRAQQDLYYWYYGTLAMYQHGGEPWRRWNNALRDTLVTDQRSDGDFAGSWNPRAPWGDYGGRVFSTALSTLCLEVYYRFLPLYQLSARPEEPPKK